MMKYDEAESLVRDAISEIELQQVEKGNTQFVMAYLVGVLTANLIESISGNSEIVINRLNQIITLTNK